MTNEILEIIKLLIKNWNTVNRIPRDTWNKIRKMFQKGDKSLGFIKRKSDFLSYYKMSKTTFLQKYHRYILPTEYKGYLLESIVIGNLYNQGKNKEADDKRIDLLKVNKKAGRLCNLFTSGILNIVFSRIDQLINEGKGEAEITGTASQIIDDLINDKSIIYVNHFHNENELFEKVKFQLSIENYCLIYGAGKGQISKIRSIYGKLMEDDELSNFNAQHSQHKIGDTDYFNLAIFHKTVVSDKSN